MVIIQFDLILFELFRFSFLILFTHKKEEEEVEGLVGEKTRRN